MQMEDIFLKVRQSDKKEEKEEKEARKGNKDRETNYRPRSLMNTLVVRRAREMRSKIIRCRIVS